VWSISERLYLGNYWSGEQALRGAKAPVYPTGFEEAFAGVVSLCPMPLEGEILLGPACMATEWLHVPIADGGVGEAEFAGALELCMPFVVSRRRLGNVLIHCAAGMSRSVSVVAAILCTDDQELDVDDAYRSIARAKAAAMGTPPEDEDLVVSPAWEFHCHLRRRFAEPTRRANGRP
jgi:hypothetical protein